MKPTKAYEIFINGGKEIFQNLALRLDLKRHPKHL